MFACSVCGVDLLHLCCCFDWRVMVVTDCCVFFVGLFVFCRGCGIWHLVEVSLVWLVGFVVCVLLVGIDAVCFDWLFGFVI